MAINTTENDIDLELAPQELIPFDFCESLGDEEYDSEPENPTPQANSYSERIQKVKDALFLSHLNWEEKMYVLNWAEDFADIFHLNGEQLSCTHLIQHRIPTTDDKVIHKKQYRSPNEALEQIDEQLTKQFNSCIIGHSSSPYNSPLLIVPKKLDASGKRKWRVVIDYRALNEKVIGDAFPLPNISGIFDKLGTARFFTVFDLASGFHQIETHPDDRHKTAFSSLNGHFEYKRMPMGIKNAPPTFQRLLNNVLGGMLDSEAFVYLDDIIIYSDTLEEHDRRARRLFSRLRAANLKLQPDKCEFLKKEVAYLGHIVGKDGVKPNPAKILAIKQFPVPKTQKEVRSFLGLSGYYRRFIKDYAKVAKPLSDLLKKTADWKWEDAQQQSFKDLRKYLCRKPILQYPDFEKPFKLTTDASQHAIGSMLTQEVDGIDLPVAYYSKVLNAAEQNYLKEEKECLAVLYSLEHFRPYLYGPEFVLSCDCEPVHWMNYVENPGTRLQKWRLKLRGYRYKFEYKPGKISRIVEALSNHPVNANDPEKKDVESPESEWTDSSEESSQDKQSEPSIEPQNSSPPLRALPITQTDTQAKSSESARVNSGNNQDNTGSSQSSAPQRLLTRSQSLHTKTPAPRFNPIPNPTREKRDNPPSSKLTRPPWGARQPPPPPATSRATKSTGSTKKPTLATESRPVIKSKSVRASADNFPVPGTSAATNPPAARPRGRPPGSTKLKEQGDEDTYVPPTGTKDVDPNISSIAKRLRKRKLEIQEKALPEENQSSSSDEPASESENEETSEAPVFRADHSVFPSVPPHITSRISSPEENIPSTSQPAIPNPLIPYIDVYVDGACCDNGGVRPRAGIGVWFGPHNPLNISKRYGGRQTNNASEIEAAVAAIKQAKRAGFQHLKIKSDSKSLVQGVQEWLPKWQQNGWKTNENKPVKNKSAYERLLKAMKKTDVIWEHVPGHNGVDGNENADRLAREGAMLELASESSSSDSSDEEHVEETPSEPVVVVGPPRPVDSEESFESSSDTEVERESTIPNVSCNQSSQLVEPSVNAGATQSYIYDQTLMWDNEFMNKTQRSRAYVSEGENDEEYLEQLKAMDPCEETNDDVFAERVNKFLESFNKNRGNARSPEQELDTQAIPSTIVPSTSETLKDTPMTSHPLSRETRSVVRFQELPEVIEENSANFPVFTPGSSTAPGAQSTPFTRFRKEDVTKPDENKRKPNIVPRRLQSTVNDLPSQEHSVPRVRSSIDIKISDIESSSSSSPEPIEIPIADKDNAKVENILHQWAEPLTFKRDNYAHFIAEDCEPVDSISKLLIATEKIDVQDIRDSKLKKGQVHVTLCGKYRVYSIVVKKRHFDELDWNDVTLSLKNLKHALILDNQIHCRMANSGDLLGNLPQNTMADILAGIFRGGDIKITLCHGKIEVPAEKLRPKIIAEFHGSLIGGHKGITKTYRRIRERYYWNRMRDEVTQFVRRCKSCLENKLVRARTREPMLITDTPAIPFDKVSLDTVGKLRTTPNGNRYILTMQDNLTKYCIAVAIPDIKTTTIAQAVATNLFSLYGAPRCVLTDRGGSFISSLMRKLERIFGTKQITTSGYRPQTNGALERSHIELTDYIKHYANDFDDWDSFTSVCDVQL
ncbi:uncharacterized protein LOC127278183 [Leptopilina boulardi]|uniref:uncharacterized protein LOC127278183 n=1 Tax=Leptopilina boulardi TaxID=63433 RepID=UPI0021F586D5|nr:uncharacterized protein LOC127278183 [Leptopilina boulardi]